MNKIYRQHAGSFTQYSKEFLAAGQIFVLNDLLFLVWYCELCVHLSFKVRAQGTTPSGYFYAQTVCYLAFVLLHHLCEVLYGKVLIF